MNINSTRLSTISQYRSDELMAQQYASFQEALRDVDQLDTQRIIRFGISRGDVLEISPAAGYLGLEWLTRTESTTLTGVGWSDALAGYAEKNAAAYGISGDRVSYYAIDEKRLPFEDNSFDAVICGNAIHTWDDPVFMFNEIHRVLKEASGQYYLSDFRRDTQFFSKVRKTLGLPSQVRRGMTDLMQASYTYEELAAILRQTKLSGSAFCSRSDATMIISGVKPAFVRLKRQIRMCGIGIETNNRRLFIDVARLQRRYKRLCSMNSQNQEAASSDCGAGGRIIHINTNINEATKAFTYILAHEIKSRDDAVDGMNVYELPPSHYAVFTVRFNEQRQWQSAVAAMRRFVYRYWLPNSGYLPAGTIKDFELHDKRSTQAHNPQIDLYVAIKPGKEDDLGACGSGDTAVSQ
ncbi:MAG: methyltransferase domain-containing protein [Chitinivibrionales bacterium]|nr:methyltransferase domain-containing protein [Chitinivibrionales bacterium]